MFPVLLVLSTVAVGTLLTVYVANQFTSDEPVRVSNDSYPSPKTYKVAPDVTCETIHICVVCMGHGPGQFYTMLKSILYHRHNPLHFHLIVDSMSEQNLTEFFTSWNLTDVKLSSYNAEYDLPKVHWIPNSHYSGISTVTKLLILDILPKHLQKVIVLDTDLTFLCNVAELWSIFKLMADQQIFALAEEQSTWYTDHGKHSPGIALGTGFNTGVMLLYLNKIPNSYWTILWHKALNISLEYRENDAVLGDQDIINALILSQPKLVYTISCVYNVQLRPDGKFKSSAKDCYGPKRKAVKIVHWNSRFRTQITPQTPIADGEYFKKIHDDFASMKWTSFNDTLQRCKFADPYIAATNLP